MALPIIDTAFLQVILWIVMQSFVLVCFDAAERAVIQHLWSIRSANWPNRRIIDVLRRNNIILASQLNELVSGIEPIRITPALTQTQNDSQSDGEILYLLRCRLYWMQLAILRGATVPILIELLNGELDEMEQ